MKLTKERIEDRNHDFTNAEIFALIEKYFLDYKKRKNIYMSKYFSRCCVLKVFYIYQNFRGVHDHAIGEFLNVIGEFCNNNCEFYTFAEKDVTEEVNKLKKKMAL